MDLPTLIAELCEHVEGLGKGLASTSIDVPKLPWRGNACMVCKPATLLLLTRTILGACARMSGWVMSTDCSGSKGCLPRSGQHDDDHVRFAVANSREGKHMSTRDPMVVPMLTSSWPIR